MIVSNLRLGTPAVYIDLPLVFAAADHRSSGGSYEMMYYNDGILAVHVTNEDWQAANESLIQFLRTSEDLHDSMRSITVVPVGVDTSRLFVRHTAQYFCYGTHTGTGSDDHRKWEVRCSDYQNNGRRKPGEALLFDDFHGNDIGSTVAFEIHDGYFYAVSNQGTYEVEEVDWTSFYHCVRFPLDNPAEETLQKDKRVYRRQHAEGAIHDSWTDLTMQHDERTNNLLIVESRREWVGASSQQARTFYTSHVDFDRSIFVDDSLDSNDYDRADSPRFPLPENDILTTLLGSSHNANYMLTPKQYSWTRHPELPPTSCQLPTLRSFMLSKTRFRAYKSSCSAFIDIVEDTQCCPNQPPCLRLRVGSRRVAPYVTNPFDNGHGKPKVKASITPRKSNDSRVHFEDDTQYRYTPIRMWPPAGMDCPCSTRVHCIMNPDTRGALGICSGRKTVSAVCDERSIVYMVKSNHLYGYHSIGSSGVNHAPGTIVLVDFGRALTSVPSAEHSGVSRWEWTPDQQRRCREGTC